MNVEEVIQYWRKSARDDWRTANRLRDVKEYVPSLFFLHLHLEKILKAKVVEKIKKHAPWTHNLRALAEQAGLEISDDQRLFLRELSEYCIEARYPSKIRKMRSYTNRRTVDQFFKKVKEFKRWLTRNEKP